MIAIEKNISLPNKHQKNTYPWEAMEVGDAFALKAGTQGASAYNMARAATAKLTPKIFKGGKASDGRMMIWRIL